MGLQMPTPFDMVVLFAFCFGIVVVALTYLAWTVRQIEKSTREIERLTRAVGVLVVQEAGKIRTLMSR